MSTLAQDFIKAVKEIQEPAKVLYGILQSERVSFELIRGDIEALSQKRSKLADEIKLLELDRDTQWQDIKIMKKKAQVEIDDLIAAHRSKVAEGIRLLEQVKAFCKGIDKQQWENLREKVKAA